MNKNNIKKRVKEIEKKIGGQNFAERMENIFSTGCYDQLSSEDVSILQEHYPEKFDILRTEIYKEMCANI